MSNPERKTVSQIFMTPDGEQMLLAVNGDKTRSLQFGSVEAVFILIEALTESTGKMLARQDELRNQFMRELDDFAHSMDAK